MKPNTQSSSFFLLPHLKITILVKAIKQNNRRSEKGNKYINPLTDFGFKKVLKVVELTKFTKDERKEYEEILKTYRDIKNVVDTAKEEGREKGKVEEKEGVVERCWKKGMTVEDIVEISELTVEQVQLVIDKIKKSGKK